MKKVNNHINSEFETNNQALLDKKRKEIHAKELGLGIPKDYFATSKRHILEKVSKQKEVPFPFFSRERILWSVAASIALIFAITVFKPNVLPSIKNIPSIVSDTIDQLQIKNVALENFELEEDNLLIASLFVEESDIDEFVTDYVLEELVYEEVLKN